MFNEKDSDSNTYCEPTFGCLGLGGRAVEQTRTTPTSLPCLVLQLLLYRLLRVDRVVCMSCMRVYMELVLRERVEEEARMRWMSASFGWVGDESGRRVVGSIKRIAAASCKEDARQTRATLQPGVLSLTEQEMGTVTVNEKEAAAEGHRSLAVREMHPGFGPLEVDHILDKSMLECSQGGDHHINEGRESRERVKKLPCRLAVDADVCGPWRGGLNEAVGDGLFPVSVIYSGVSESRETLERLFQTPDGEITGFTPLLSSVIGPYPQYLRMPLAPSLEAQPLDGPSIQSRSTGTGGKDSENGAVDLVDALSLCPSKHEERVTTPATILTAILGNEFTPRRRSCISRVLSSCFVLALWRPFFPETVLDDEAKLGTAGAAL
ncbi:hypothetical protein B0H19DRAFT_1062278 [Mycena capillaripes]|nr:hypothetical protein B0H19DRAFT_1062278 [Mycena capillaripes]